MKTNIVSRIFGFAAVLLALVAIGGANVAHAAGPQLATAPAGGSQLSIGWETQAQTVKRGETYVFYYKVYNAGPDKAEVKFEASSDSGWQADVSSLTAIVPPNSSVEFKVQVTVPQKVEQKTSVLKIGAFAADSSAVTTLQLTVAPSVGGR
ncbi:MAG TPA: hypothetical protein VM536_14525 [Chloroflexia bacterium]|nr:hypothetical protein [Chloroflexia bacterium]